MERQKGERKEYRIRSIERMSDLFSVEMGTMIYTHAVQSLSSGAGQ